MGLALEEKHIAVEISPKLFADVIDLSFAGTTPWFDRYSIHFYFVEPPGVYLTDFEVCEEVGVFHRFLKFCEAGIFDAPSTTRAIVRVVLVSKKAVAFEELLDYSLDFGEHCGGGTLYGVGTVHCFLFRYSVLSLSQSGKES
jgi:hypothetical protein